MKYKAFKKRERELLANGINSQIDEIQDSNAEEDIEKIKVLKRYLQDIIDHKNNEAAV